MEFIELKTIKALVTKARHRSSGEPKPSVAISEWPGGWVVVFYVGKDKYLLRTRHEAKVRIIVRVEVALKIVKSLGFTFCVVSLKPEERGPMLPENVKSPNKHIWEKS